MSFPEGPIHILGVPYAIEFTDLPDPDDVNGIWIIDREVGSIRLQSGTTEAYAGRSLFEAAIREAVQLLSPDHKMDRDQELAFGRVYYGMLRTNPEALAYCGGWSDEVPGTVDVTGTQWSIRLVDYCPGCDRDTFGYTVYREQTIYIRKALPTPLKRSTLVHELGHAVADACAPAFQNDEAFMRAIHTTIAAVLRDNPDLCRELFT